MPVNSTDYECKRMPAPCLIRTFAEPYAVGLIRRICMAFILEKEGSVCRAKHRSSPLRMWTSAAELAALRERNRLARAMHDGLGHALVLVNVKLEAAERLYARDPAHGAAELEATRALVRATMADLSRSLTELREAPASSDLVAGLHTLAAEVTARGQLTVTADLPSPYWLNSNRRRARRYG